MSENEKIIQLACECEEPSDQLRPIYDMVREILHRVMNIESSVVNRTCICKCTKAGKED